MFFQEKDTDQERRSWIADFIFQVSKIKKKSLQFKYTLGSNYGGSIYLPFFFSVLIWLVLMFPYAWLPQTYGGCNSR